MVLHAPLDLQYWLMNVFAGRPMIFFFVSLIAIAILSARFKMSNLSFGIILLLFLALMVPYGLNGAYIIGLLLLGIGIFFTISKIVNR